MSACRGRVFLKSGGSAYRELGGLPIEVGLPIELGLPIGRGGGLPIEVGYSYRVMGLPIASCSRGSACPHGIVGG